MANGELLADLLVRAETGDQTVLRDLVGHYHSRLVARLRGRVPVDQAEDIVQVALATACLKLDQFVWSGWDAFEAWLWLFVEYARADHFKHRFRDCRNPQREVGDSPQPGSDSSQGGMLANVPGREEPPTRPARHHERDERLRRAMGEHLTDDQRVALELRYFEFLSVEEVSQRTGWTKSNVTTLCQRGYKRLREVLTESMWSSGGS